MALFSHATVNFSDASASKETDYEDATLLTLAHQCKHTNAGKSALTRANATGNTEVLFGTALFDIHTDSLKTTLLALAPTPEKRDKSTQDTISAITTDTPTIVLNIVIDNAVLMNHPRALEKIRNYLHAHKPSLQLGKLSVVNGSSNLALPKNAIEPSNKHSAIIVMGSAKFLSTCLHSNHFESNNSPVVFMPVTAIDHAMLTADTVNLLPSIACIVNDNALYHQEPQASLQQFIANATAVALKQDSQLFHWIEGNASQLAQLDRRAIDYLVKRCFNLRWPYHPDSQNHQPNVEWNATKTDTRFCIALRDATDGFIGEADATALYLLLICHSSVNAQTLNEGAEARVWHLLNTLGFSLWHHGMQAAIDQYTAIKSTNELAQLTDIGSSTAPAPVSKAQTAAWVSWLSEQAQ